MKHSDKSFVQTFEQYLFKVASQSIDLADAATQTDLIHLLTKVSGAAEHIDPVVELTQSEPSEWNHILNEPVGWRSVHQQWLLGIHRARQERTSRYVQQLESVIATTYTRWQQVQMSQLGESRRSRLIAYYEQTLDSYQHHLVQVLATQTLP